jgi:NADPH:quinone reductase-like Zn-dependent oxidoreductase
MKALVYSAYGGPQQLAIRDVQEPRPGKSEVLVRLVACGVNLSDWEYLTGRPAYARIAGLRRPRRPILGSDIAGVVEALGEGVTRFKPGDAVFGDVLMTRGGFAELVTANESALIAKPDDLGFVEAAALPQAGVIALQGMAGVMAGQKVLINGGGGGGGSFALQIARARGAEVTGVDSAAKLDLMRRLGAEHVIDYEQQDFTTTGRRYDHILDLVASRSPFAIARALAPGGRYLAVGGPVRVLLSLLIAGAGVGLVTGRRIGILAVRPGPEPLQAFTDLVRAGQVFPEIGETFPLARAAEALAQLGAGKSRGKLVVTME